MDFILINGYPVGFVFWNVFLAIIPCVIAYLTYCYYVKRQAGLSWGSMTMFLPIFLLWFFFFPNTAYLFTEVRYLVDYCEPETMLRLCRDQAYVPPFFFFYASIGIPTFIYALKRMSQTLGYFYAPFGWLFPLLMIPATAIGTLLGLLERFNSWNIVQDPLIILKTGLNYFNDPIMLKAVIGYSLLMYFLYYVFPLAFRYVQND